MRYPFARIDREKRQRRELQGEVDLASRERFRLAGARIRCHILNVGEPLQT